MYLSTYGCRKHRRCQGRRPGGEGKRRTSWCQFMGRVRVSRMMRHVIVLPKLRSRLDRLIFVNTNLPDMGQIAVVMDGLREPAKQSTEDRPTTCSNHRMRCQKNLPVQRNALLIMYRLVPPLAYTTNRPQDTQGLAEGIYFSFLVSSAPPSSFFSPSPSPPLLPLPAVTFFSSSYM